MVEAATEFRKSGFGDEDAANLALVATQFQNVADSEISAGEASSFIIAQLKAFNIEAENATHITDAVNEVSNQFAVSSTDLSNSLGIVSSALASGNTSFEESLGMLTAITEITRNASKASRGLVSIQSRLNQVVDEGSATGKQLIDLYAKQGIDVFDKQTGQLRDTYDVLKDLSESWDSLTRNEQAEFALAQAGANQTQNFVALMENFSQAVSATATAYDSAGSAAQENAKHMESLEAKTQQLKATFQDFSNNVIDNELIKSILNLADTALNALNTEAGATITQWVLLTGVLTGASTIFGNIGIKLASSLLNFSANMGTLVTAVSAGTATLASFVSVAFPLAAILTGIGLALWKIKEAYDAANPSIEDAAQKVKDLSASQKEVQDKITELNGTPWYKRTSEIDEETNALQKENAELQKQIDFYNEKYAAQFGAGKSGKTEVAGYRATYDRDVGFDTETKGLTLVADSAEELEEKLNDLRKSQTLTNVSIKEVNRELSNTEAWKKASDAVKALEEEKSKSGLLTGAQTKQFREETSSLSEFVKEIDDSGVSLNYFSEDIQNLYNYSKQFASALDDVSEGISGTEKSLDKLSKGLAINESDYKKLIAVYPDLIGLITQTSDGYTIETNTLIDLAKTGNSAAKQMLQDQIDLTKGVIENSQKRLTALQEEMDALGQLIGTTTDPNKSLQYEKMYGLKAATANRLKDIIASKLELLGKMQSGIGGVAIPSPGSGDGTVTDPIKEQSNLFKEQNAVLEHNIYLREKAGASEQELIQLNKEYQETLNKQADWFRGEGEEESSTYIQELQKSWWGLQDNIVTLENNITQKLQSNFDKRLELSESYIEDRNFYDNWGADNEIAAWKRVLVWMEEEYYKKGLISFQEYVDTRNEIMKNIYTAEQEAAEKAQEAAEEAQQQYIESLEDKQSLYEKFFNYMVDRIDEEIEKLEDEYDATEAFWDSKINAIQEANEELEQQIELEEAMDDLARARQTKVMVYKDGRFQYVNDIDEVSEAQSNLEKLEREEALRQEVANLEQLKEQALQAIQDQIDGWEEYKDEWSSVVDHYQEEQDRLLIEQELGIELEGENWKNRLDNLQDYANQYQEILNSIVLAQQQANAQLGQLQQGSNSGSSNSDLPYNWTGSGGLSNWSGGTQTNDQGWVTDGKVAAIIDGVGGGAVPVWYDPDTGKVMSEGLEPGDIILTQGGYYKITGGSGGSYTSVPWSPGGSSSSSNNRDDNDDDGYSDSSNISSGAGGVAIGGAVGGAVGGPIGGIVGGVIGGIIGSITGKHANGTLSASSGLSLVGENGPELRMLGQGDGIIPADVTKNLWSWGMTTPSSMLSALSGIGSSTSNATQISIGNITLPSVSNASQFVEELKGFKRYAIQYGTGI